MSGEQNRFIKSLKGFTLIELLVVIAIIGILSTLAMVAVGYARGLAKIAKAQNETDELYKAITTMSNDTGFWPGHQAVDAINAGTGNEICGDGCAFGLGAPESGLQATDGVYENWSGPYIAAVPLDAWGHEYFFDTDYRVVDATNAPCADAASGCVDAVVVGSYGPDGIGNNLYNADDVIKVIIK